MPHSFPHSVIQEGRPVNLLFRGAACQSWGVAVQSGVYRGVSAEDRAADRRRRLLDHLALHGRCTNREYQDLSGTSARTGLRDLQDLIDRGLIQRDGKRRGAVYRLR